MLFDGGPRVEDENNRLVRARYPAGEDVEFVPKVVFLTLRYVLEGLLDEKAEPGIQESVSKSNSRREPEKNYYAHHNFLVYQ